MSAYPWVKNWLFTLQRYTGLIAFAYIAWHLYTERWLTHGRSTYATVEHDMANPLYLTFFLIGVLASSFHLGVGIWNFLCKWGWRRRCALSGPRGSSACSSESFLALLACSLF